MKETIVKESGLRSLIIILTILGTSVFSQNMSNHFSEVSGPYLGQKPPGLTPEVFAPNIISHGFHELGIGISPDGKEIFYITSDNRYKLYTIIRVRRENNIWMAPEVASFSGFHTDNNLCFSPDGNTLFFRSKRPLKIGTAKDTKGNFWYVEKKGQDWSVPVSLGSPLNTKKNELALSVAANGSIYFSARYGNDQNIDLYVSKLIDGKYSQPEKLSDRINSNYAEHRPYVSPDESLILFQSDRPGSLGQHDLYVSFRNEDDSWCEPINLGNVINTPLSEFAPYISPDGKYLFFSSYRTLDPEIFQSRSYSELLELYCSAENGYATLFWVDASVVYDLHP